MKQVRICSYVGHIGLFGKCLTGERGIKGYAQSNVMIWGSKESPQLSEIMGKANKPSKIN